MLVKRLRQASVAGYYYPDDATELRRQLGQSVPRHEIRTQAVGVLVPHGPHRFSGAITGKTLGRVAMPSCCVILSPNHLGLGRRWSLMADGAYETPLGCVPIDELLCGLLQAANLLVGDDEQAHRAEHAIEVILPFMQWVAPEDLTIVPLVINSVDPDECAEVAAALADVIGQSGKRVLVIASSDLSHYAPAAQASTCDAKLLEAMRTLDGRHFLRTVSELGVTTCGAGAVACWLQTTRRLGATDTTLIEYGTSAQAGGDPHAVVGYAGLVAS